MPMPSKDDKNLVTDEIRNKTTNVTDSSNDLEKDKDQKLPPVLSEEQSASTSSETEEETVETMDNVNVVKTTFPTIVISFNVDESDSNSIVSYLHFKKKDGKEVKEKIKLEKPIYSKYFQEFVEAQNLKPNESLTIEINEEGKILRAYKTKANKKECPVTIPKEKIKTITEFIAEAFVLNNDLKEAEKVKLAPKQSQKSENFSDTTKKLCDDLTNKAVTNTAPKTNSTVI